MKVRNIVKKFGYLLKMKGFNIKIYLNFMGVRVNLNSFRTVTQSVNIMYRNIY